MLRESACLAIGVFAVGCTVDVTVEGAEGLTPVVAVGLDAQFERVGAELGVPGDLLEAIGYTETRWQNVVGEAELEGQLPATGIMALRDDVLADAAALANVDEQDLREDPESNIRGAAALLVAAADRMGLAPADRGDLGAWAYAVAEYSGIADEDSRAAYVLRGVYEVLRTGATEIAESGEVVATLPPHPGITPDYEYTPPQFAIGGGDYAAANWTPSPNYSARPSGVRASMVIIHTCEGAFAGCAGWLRNSASGVSAHYVVKENGGEVAQLVREASKAWHIAAAYKCSLNGDTDCAKNGSSSNNFTVGIEHAGFGAQASWPAAQIEASAKLVCDITKRNGIARDRQHIVGHGQLQPYNRTDPGPNWPWTSYIARIKELCGDGGGGGTPPPPTTTPGTIIIDSNAANNDPAKAKLELTGTWTSSNSTPGYYGTGYWVADTKAASEPATFSFYAAAAGTRTIDAWWTGGANRASAAVFIAQNASGAEVGRVTKNQQQNAGSWVTLGTWSFSAGWNKVVLSRWTTAGQVVVADALRVR